MALTGHPCSASLHFASSATTVSLGTDLNSSSSSKLVGARSQQRPQPMQVSRLTLAFTVYILSMPAFKNQCIHKYLYNMLS